MRLKRMGKRLVIVVLALAAAYVIGCAATGLTLMRLVYRVHEAPVDYALFSDVILTEEAYRQINQNWHAADAPGTEVECEVSITFPIACITWGRAKAVYWMDYESADSVTACSRLPVIVEMVWDGGWRIERAAAIEFSTYDYGVTFP